MSDDTPTKEDHIINFIKAFHHYEQAMEPYKEGKRDLRNSYRDNDYLTTEEMQQAIRAFRFIQKDVDMDELQSFRDILRKKGVVKDES